MFTANMNLSPDLMNDIFIKRINPYNLRRNDIFSIRQVSSVYHRTESLSFLRSKIWELVMPAIKNIQKYSKEEQKSGSLLNVPVDCARSISRE